MIKFSLSLIFKFIKRKVSNKKRPLRLDIFNELLSSECTTSRHFNFVVFVNYHLVCPCLDFSSTRKRLGNFDKSI